MFKSKTKVGILGGGQLGQMWIQAAVGFDVEVHVLDPDNEAPCKHFCANFVNGDYLDFDTVVKFGENLDVVTIEFENVNVEALFELQSMGVKVYPQPEIIKLIQDKGAQKLFYKENGIASSEFVLVDNLEDFGNVSDEFFPVFQKLRRGGYDGKGVIRVKSKLDLENAFDAPSVLERAVELDKEVGVIVARSATGEVKAFGAVDLIFNEKANLVEFLYTPSSLSFEIQEKAKLLAEDLVQKLEIVGLLAVEMFVTKDGDVLVNEVAPRPHNSGHSTIESNVTSQFEQHLRAILGLALGDVAVVRPSVMINLLGAEGYSGKVKYEGVDQVLKIEGVHLHLYGKTITKPYRKMGHLNVTAETLEKAIEKAQNVKNLIQIKS
jgi:5-(carboxyamino)imidazole ribonucleotide synthase